MSSSLLRTSLLAGAVLSAFVGPAFALSDLTYVSSMGANSGSCSTEATACRTFNYAIGQTRPQGEVKALTPGNFGTFSIDKSITVSGGEGVIVQGLDVHPNAAISIDTAADVNLVGLEIIGGTSASDAHGVYVKNVGNVTIKNSIIREFRTSGITFNRTTNQGVSKFLIEDTTILNGPGAAGVRIGIGLGIVYGAVHRVSINDVGTGVSVAGHSRVAVTETAVVNGNIGYEASEQGRLEIARSTASANQKGIFRNGADAIVESAGDNFFRNNSWNVVGGISVVGGQ
jgi:hypothetical protein